MTGVSESCRTNESDGWSLHLIRDMQKSRIVGDDNGCLFEKCRIHRKTQVPRQISGARGRNRRDLFEKPIRGAAQ